MKKTIWFEACLNRAVRRGLLRRRSALLVASVGLEAEVVDQAEHAVVPEHGDVSGPDRLRLGEDALLYVVEGPIGDEKGGRKAPTSCRS